MNNMLTGNGSTAATRISGVSQYDYLYLGEGAGGLYCTDPAKSQTNSNVLTIAGTGGGKTKSVVEPNLLHATHQSLVVLLTKRLLLQEYGPLLKKKGYNVLLLDLVQPGRSDVGYDPLLHIKDDSDIRSLAKQLIVASGCGSPRDPYWEASPASLMRAFVKLARHKFGKQATMSSFLELYRYINVSESVETDDFGEVIRVNKFAPGEDFEALQDADLDMYMDWRQYLDNAPNTAANIAGVLTAALGTLSGEDIRQLMDKKPQLSFPSLVRQKTALFILTSPVNPAHHPFANLVLGTMLKELFEYAESLPSGRLPIPLTLICDDFATGGKIPDFQHHISIFREKGISAIMLVQSLSQLESMYGREEAVTIRDNTDNVVYLGGNDVATAKQIAELVNRPLEEVLCLPIGQEYLIRRGQLPLQLQRYQIFSDPLYKREIVHSDVVTTR